MYALINSTIYTGKKILDNHALIVSDNFIKAICLKSELPKHMEVHDLSGFLLTPGFIDLQVNGCGGVQFNDHINAISMCTLKTMQITNQFSGCTSFLPTLITSNDVLMQRAVNVMRTFLSQNNNQALGLHLEGPFLNSTKKGIHNSTLIRVPTEEMINYLCENSDVIRKITLAPEQLLDMTCIKKLQKSGICIAIGHSNATYTQTRFSFSYGVSFGTHLFNAMPPLTAREPGVIGAIFDAPEIYCSVIADGLHVHWANIRYAKKIKGDHLILVTDATSPAGLNKGKSCFLFSNKTIYHSNNRCVDSKGVLSGSTLTMIQAIKNSVEYAGIPLDEAVRMATLYPAKVIGMDHCLGSLEINKIANLTVFNTDYQIKKTIVNGKIVNTSLL
ncbi:N-acetylglucosamine-6-phosphate deacetylase [Blochmannia endosymbiont of Camponotus sp. C-046]|uniref:N-acetylglucosamine-6-phosphate deacetylase n=1 Tax=Blochmannia endosymbiont of Camponotus sp. C-046 TaxID=2945589 RepID=UPI002025AD61|nr:N-acetylglucosamine-6-phosphate deacetylase [Blochmannia endosymbiont of Camponotus sp. C-046]URJ28963.1 N-acetylglucosamine-6-phosphate deacetylase [Blochmannia endosymbiont of Camponotus sp. C-046]